MGAWGNLDSLRAIIAGGKQAQRQQRTSYYSGDHGGGSSSSGGNGALMSSLVDAVRSAASQGRAQQQASELAKAYRQAVGLGGDYQVTFGQTKKGKYSGFATEGELKAASLGRGRELYGRDQSAAADIADRASKFKAGTETAYERALREMKDAVAAGVLQARPDVWTDGQGHALDDATVKAMQAASMRPDAKDVRRFGVPDGSGGLSATGDHGYSPILAVTTPGGAVLPQERPNSAVTSRVTLPQGAALSPEQLGLTRQDVTYAQQAADAVDAGRAGAWGLGGIVRAGGRARDTDLGTSQHDTLYGADYENRLGSWRNAQDERAATVQALADAIGGTPFNQYVQRGAADYGVDPYLASGWFGPGINDNEFKDQRDTQSLSENGLPYTEYQRALDNQTKQATAADKQAEDQAHSMYLDDAYQQLGIDGDQLAQSADLTTDQVASYLQSPDFQNANQAVQQAISDAAGGNYDTIAQLFGDPQAGTPGQLTLGDPVMSRIFEAAYGDQIKAALDALGG